MRKKIKTESLRQSVTTHFLTKADVLKSFNWPARCCKLPIYFVFVSYLLLTINVRSVISKSTGPIFTKLSGLVELYHIILYHIRDF